LFSFFWRDVGADVSAWVQKDRSNDLDRFWPDICEIRWKGKFRKSVVVVSPLFLLLLP